VRPACEVIAIVMSPPASASRSEATGAVTVQLRELGMTLHFHPAGAVTSV